MVKEEIDRKGIFMNKIKAIYPLSKSPLNEQEFDESIFMEFYDKKISNDELFKYYLFQIHRHIRRLKVDQGKLYIDKNTELASSYTIPMSDFVSGIFFETEIIKKMVSKSHVYEWRVHRKNFNPRGIFFPYDSYLLEKHPGLIYCYGFIKNYEYDPTQKYVEKTQLIRDKFYNNEMDDTYIGEEIVDYD